MREVIVAQALALCLSLGLATPVRSQDDGSIGTTAASLLDFARGRNPEYAMLQSEADAASQRIVAAGALADPRLLVELRDITRFGEQNPTLSPARVGSTRYLLTQELPWFGKRGLKREIAEFEAESARGKAAGTWSEVAAKIKTAHAQRYYLDRNLRLTREILDLIRQLEKIALLRYGSGLAAQQDVIRAQIEHTGVQGDLVALEGENRQMAARLNSLLARPPAAPLARPEILPPLPAPTKLDYAALEDRVRARNPLLFAEESRLKAAEKSRDLSFRNRFPDFIVGVGPIQYQNAIKEWELMVELNIPLQQSSRRAQERESEAMLSAAKARKEALANQVLGELAENLAAIEAARENERLATTGLLPQAELTFRSALAGYRSGKVDFATLLEAQRKIREAGQKEIKAQSEAQIRLAEVERLLGEDL